MKQNVGGTERALRIVVGIVLLSATALLDGPERWHGLIGVIPLATGIAGNCPLYTLFGLTTCLTTNTRRR